MAWIWQFLSKHGLTNWYKVLNKVVETVIRQQLSLKNNISHTEQLIMLIYVLFLYQ
jgi:hypothetical protein